MRGVFTGAARFLVDVPAALALADQKHFPVEGVTMERPTLIVVAFPVTLGLDESPGYSSYLHEVSLVFVSVGKEEDSTPEAEVRHDYEAA
jgi:hypothetical protein